VPESPGPMSVEEFRKYHFVYDGSQSGQPITKLFLPVQTVNTIRQWEKFSELQCLSFDRSWMKSNGKFEFANAQINLMPLKGVVELKELYMPSWGQRHDLTLLAGQEKLETLQFTSSSTGFSVELFPNLKHVILVVDEGSPSDEMLLQINALESLEKITIVPGHQFMSGFIANPKQLETLFKGALLPRVTVEVLQPYSNYLPDDFAEHCDRVREQCRARYLRE